MALNWVKGGGDRERLRERSGTIGGCTGGRRGGRGRKRMVSVDEVVGRRRRLTS